MISVTIETLDPETGELLLQRNLDVEFLDLSAREGRRRFAAWLRREGIQQVDRRILDQLNAPSDFEYVEPRPVPLGSMASAAYESALASGNAVRERNRWEAKNGLLPYGQQTENGKRVLTRVIAGRVSDPVTLLVGNSKSRRKRLSE